MSLPADAGPVLYDLRASRRTIVIWSVVAALLALMILGDPTTWPIAAVFGSITAITWLILRLRRTVVALCENGFVVRKLASYQLVPWSELARLRRIRGKYTTYILVYGGSDAMLPKHPAAALRIIEERGQVTSLGS